MAADATASVWIVELPADERDIDAAWSLLAADEQARAERFRIAADRTSYVYGHAALRLLLETHLERSLDRAPFAVREQGKPYLIGSTVGFSFARSLGKAAVAIIGDGEIGVDVEAIASDESDVAIAQTTYSDGERNWIAQSDDRDERRRRFYRLWVIREAFAKATGQGLGREFRERAIDIVGDSPALATQAWRALEGPLREGFAAAVVVPRQRSVIWNEISWQTLSATSA
jgi:4'-phosphopantetheinyl transferase